MKMEKIMECVENGNYKQMTIEDWELECEIKESEKEIVRLKKAIKKFEKQNEIGMIKAYEKLIENEKMMIGFLKAIRLIGELQEIA